MISTVTFFVNNIATEATHTKPAYTVCSNAWAHEIFFRLTIDGKNVSATVNEIT